MASAAQQTTSNMPDPQGQSWLSIMKSQLLHTLVTGILPDLLRNPDLDAQTEGVSPAKG